MELRDGGRTGKKDGGGKTNKPSSIAPFHCRWVLQPPERSPCFSSASDDGETEGQRRRKKAGGEKNGKDLFIEGRRSGGGGGGRVDASEFLIIVTATSHLATGYTMAAVALATAWSLSDSPGRKRGGAGGSGGSGQPGRDR